MEYNPSNQSTMKVAEQRVGRMTISFEVVHECKPVVKFLGGMTTVTMPDNSVVYRGWVEEIVIAVRQFDRIVAHCKDIVATVEKEQRERKNKRIVGLVDSTNWKAV